PRRPATPGRTPRTRRPGPFASRDNLPSLVPPLRSAVNGMRVSQLLARRAKGFDNFKEFVETEYNINNSLAGKLCSVYQVFAGELDVDDVTMKQLGLDRLNLIKPFVKGKTYPDVDEWLQKGEDMPVGELKKYIKDIKDKEKDKELDVKDVLINQFLERMLSELNCSRKDLNFKLALYFQDSDLEEIKKTIKIKQRQFETEQKNSKEENQ
ncbi:MAG: hypothetical protein R6V77_06815, partial [Candidatus Cloacimonadaceae bacterium]